MSSKLILGTAQFGMDYGINNYSGKIRDAECFEILTCAFNNGITILDTAPVYGDAHRIIGEFHKNYTNIRYKVITKIPTNYPLEKLEELVDDFLDEMNIDCIEVLHFHSINDYISYNKLKTKKVFSNLKKAKKVNFFGVSIYENLEADLLSNELIDVVQLPFNLIDNFNQRGRLIDELKSKEYQIHTRSVFLQGLFFKDAINIKSMEIKEALIYLKGLCNLYHCEIAHLALNYCLSQQSIDRVLIGVDSLDHLKENIYFLNNPLKTNFLEQINAIDILNNSQLNPSKWKVE